MEGAAGEDEVRISLKYFLTDNRRWMHFKTVNVNHSWMSTVDEKTGYGNIDKEDFVKLMESLGFRVDEAKTVSLNYKLHKDFVKGFVQENIMNDFPEIEGEEREEFFKEYLPRVEQLNKVVSHVLFNLIVFQRYIFFKDCDGYYDSNLGGVQIIGEKVRDV